MTALNTLTVLSPLDGRYANSLDELRVYFSEFALIKHRLKIEVEWLITLGQHPDITHVPPLTTSEQHELRQLVANFTVAQAEQIKVIEQKTKHDVKAVEYYLKDYIAEHKTLRSQVESVHFALTSADVNNLAYALMLQQAKQHCLLPILKQLCEQLRTLISESQTMPMLSRTHGQPASPTTLGKEIAVFLSRFQRQITALKTLPIFAKCNGAVGNHSAHHIAYPNINWLSLSHDFIQGLGLACTTITTQIESHDTLAEHADLLCRINTIAIDFCRDMWGYISLKYFTQHAQPGQVGSSTMPHKINPINFENAEGNLGIANALLTHLARKLPCSRFQRDLTDSTVLRNLGVALGHCLLGYQNITQGLLNSKPNPGQLQEELEQHWEVLAEPVQTIMRQYHIEQAYEKLKTLTQGHGLNRQQYVEFVTTLDIPGPAKKRLLQLTPATYVGLADKTDYLNLIKNET